MISLIKEFPNKISILELGNKAVGPTPQNDVQRNFPQKILVRN